MESMAALATEDIQELGKQSCFERPLLAVVDQELLDAAALADTIVTGQNQWFAAHLLPSVQAERDRRDAESASMVAEKQQQLREGNFEAVGYAYNILTTAHKLRLAKESGTNVQEVARLEKALWMDSKTHVAEAWRRLTYEYFPEIEQQYDPDKESYVYEGYIVNEVADNGISPVGSEEVGIDVAIADRRENYTANYLGKLARKVLDYAGVEVASNHITMATVSQIDVSPQTMIRGIRIDPVTNRRYQEQVGFTKEHITHKVIVKAFKQLEVIDTEATPSQLDILSTQIVNPTGEGVMSIMQTLDEVASQETGLNIFMGEEVSWDHPKDYDAIKTEAAARQSQQDDDARALMKEIQRLESEGVDGWQANMLIDTFVTNRILDQVTDNPEAARNVFGEETADRIERSMALREQGEYEAAMLLIEETRVNAPMATVCTGGSCGLEAVKENESRTLVKELGGKEGDSVLKDKVRSCPECGKKKLVYVFNSSEVRTKCTGCKEERYEKRSVK